VHRKHLRNTMYNHLRELHTKVLPLSFRIRIRKLLVIAKSALSENSIDYQSALPESRHEYKSTWNVLSQTMRQATLHVIGDVGENEIRATAQETRKILESSVGIRPDDVILEIGCGIGRAGQVMAPLCKQWIGCDVSVNMLKHAKRRLKSCNNVKLIEISGFDLSPIPNASIDLVYCTVVFMHLDEWDRYNYILEAYRVLRPGGRIFVDNFNLCSTEGWNVFEIHRQHYPRYRPPHIGKSSTPQEIEVYLKRAGFQQIKIQEQGTWVRGLGTK
jgi:ubiquinone/menaquinone biosynthesis C-methylase UbiE